MFLDREILVENLINVLKKIKHNKNKLNKIKLNLMRYNIREGIIHRLVVYPKELFNVDLRFLCLLTEELFKITNDPNLNPRTYFTEIELKNSRTYDGILEKIEILKLPLTIKNVLMIDNENYITLLDIKFIKQMMDSKLLRYNFETQRDAKFIKRKDSIEKVININKKSVIEIRDKLLSNSLSPTTITFNALVGTSNIGEELIYDPTKMELTITEGTFIDIIDGFHRILGSLEALDINPELDFKFQVAIKNYNVRTAQRYIAEVATINEINKTHIEALKASKRSDDVVKQLQRDSDLKELISTSHIFKASNKIVSYKVLADTIEEEFYMKTKRDAMEVAEYLTEFFDYLLGSYSRAFFTDYERINRESIINANPMFAGYIILAKKMKDEGVKIYELTKILDSIDFSRDNKQWEELNILKNGVLTKNALKNIKKFFRNLDFGVRI